MGMTPRAIAKGQGECAASNFAGVIAPFARTVSRLAVVFLMGSGLSACAVGSMGAMMGGSADGVAALSAEAQVQVADVAVETAVHQEFTAMAEVIETPVWAALGPLEDEDGGFFNLGSMVGMLLAGNDDENAARATSTDDAARYVHSLDGIFEDRGEAAVALAVDVYRKNNETRRFLAAAREIVNAHARPISAVNAAFQAGELEAAPYRAELSQLDADRRVLSRVVASLMEQRRTFARARMLLTANGAVINLSRADEELAALAQYEDMVTRLSATLSGEADAGA